MAAALLAGALPFHVGVQRQRQERQVVGARGSSSFASPRLAQTEFVLGFHGGFFSRAMPLLLSNSLRQQTSASLLLPSGRNRVRVAALKDSQREALDERATPIELGSPPSPNGSSENGSEETREDLVVIAGEEEEEEVASLKEAEQPSEEGVSDAVKGTVIATLLLLACVGGFGVLSFVYKEQINDLLTQFSDLLEGQCEF
jgi:hypothetical protein